MQNAECRMLNVKEMMGAEFNGNAERKGSAEFRIQNLEFCILHSTFCI